MAAGELPAAGPAEPNPFSFHEFVRSKARSGEEVGGARQVGPGRSGGRSPPRRGARPAPAPLPLSPAQAAPPGPSLGPRLLPEPPPPAEDEEEWSGTYRPSAVEQAHLAAAGSPSAGSFFYGAAGLAGGGDPSAASLGAAPGPGFQPLRQPSYEELKEENASLRSKIDKLQTFSETQADKMRRLERKLEENKLKEEKEAQDLEAMVQHVEQNLQLMTKRAVKAENSAAKLKQENALLQVQLQSYKTENEALRLGQSASLAAVKQNADVALQNLRMVITNSRASIQQLVSGAESLQLVADLLKSIDRISEVSEDGQ